MSKPSICGRCAAVCVGEHIAAEPKGGILFVHDSDRSGEMLAKTLDLDWVRCEVMQVLSCVRSLASPPACATYHNQFGMKAGNYVHFRSSDLRHP